MTTPVTEAPVAVDVDALLNTVSFTPIKADDPYAPCDGHDHSDIRAVVKLTKGVFEVELCGNCARKWGYEHTPKKPENRNQGSDN